MAEIFLSLMARPCRHADCQQTAGMFGVCKQHQDTEVRRYFARAEAAQVLPKQRPKCFKDETQWQEYVVAVMFAHPRAKERGQPRPVPYCRDCTKGFRAQMLRENRCDHQETVFIVSDRHGGDQIGVSLDVANKASTSAWELALSGQSGPITELPPVELVDKIMLQLNTKRKPGRPRKVDSGE